MPSPTRKIARATGRWLARLVALLAIVAAVGAAGGFLYLRSSLPNVAGKLRLAGLIQQVEIIRDANGVPHIFAASDDDAFFALGFVHAQDRLAQMELMRLTAQGRLAEVIGEPALDSDRFMRTLGFKDQVERDMAALSPAARATLEAYARGVNAYLLTHRGAWPPEFLLTGERPGPWRPQEFAAVGQTDGAAAHRQLARRDAARAPVDAAAGDASRSAMAKLARRYRDDPARPRLALPHAWARSSRGGPAAAARTQPGLQ